MDLETRRQALLAKRSQILASLRHTAHKRLESSETESISELSAYDNHPGDLGTATFEREKEVGFRIEADHLLSQVEGALHRLDDGTYGRCMLCGRPIAPGRLAVEPWAERCLSCEEASTRRGRNRPVEEEILSPPFGRSFRDGDHEGTVEFDGEDAWQAVARWGSSETPSDVPPAVDYDETYVNSREPIGIVEEVEGIPEKRRDRTRSNEIDG